MDDFQQTLDKFAVPPAEQEELKTIIESTHEAIVVSPLKTVPWPGSDDMRAVGDQCITGHGGVVCDRRPTGHDHP